MKIWTALLSVILLLIPAHGSAQETFDVIIRNGRVLDGSGNPWFSADVGIRGDHIAAVGDLSGARAEDEIDAAGLYVAPGFIDTHSHSGGGLVTQALSHARPLLAQGITTVFVNPDGGGPVDLSEQREDLMQYGLGVNTAQFVPHTSIRRQTIGMEARAPSPEELEEMKAWVRAGMEEGAWGLSSATFYAPGNYAGPGEIIALAEIVAEYGGAYQSHPRDESDYTIGVLAAAEEIIDVSRRTGIPVIVTHIKVLGPPVWGFSTALVRRIERARQEGYQVYADQYPYTASATGLTSALLPRWAQVGGRDSLLARLDDPDTLARIKEDMEENLARRGGADRIQFRRVQFEESLEGRTLDQVAEEWGVSPIDASVRLFRLGSPSIVSFNMHEADVRGLMVQPWTMTASDGDLVPWQVGVPHPRSYGTFPRKIRQYVVEEGLMDLASAIRTMTSLPANVFRMAERGMIRSGAMADVVVFDLARVLDLATYTQPHQLSEGMIHVFVNGEVAMRNGEFTGSLAGRVLRKGL
jgi:N-acyl-D-aspartate/D-glutamate deacylase